MVETKYNPYGPPTDPTKAFYCPEGLEPLWFVRLENLDILPACPGLVASALVPRFDACFPLADNTHNRLPPAKTANETKTTAKRLRAKQLRAGESESAGKPELPPAKKANEAKTRKPESPPAKKVKTQYQLLAKKAKTTANPLRVDDPESAITTGKDGETQPEGRHMRQLPPTYSDTGYVVFR